MHACFWRSDTVQHTQRTCARSTSPGHCHHLSANRHTVLSAAARCSPCTRRARCITPLRRARRAPSVPQLLRDSDVRVALITRNTTASVDAFFDLVGQQWRSAFDRVLTREWRYVKPDKRLLIDLAEVRRWRCGCG